MAMSGTAKRKGKTAIKKLKTDPDEQGDLS